MTGTHSGGVVFGTGAEGGIVTVTFADAQHDLGGIDVLVNSVTAA